MTLGLRYDDSGNPWSKSDTTVFGNFYLGTGTTEQEQIANGYAKATHNALLHSVNNLFSPRIGVAWDPTGNGDWVVRGGFGIYNNWLTQANVQEEFRGSPPGLVLADLLCGWHGYRAGSHFCSRKQQQAAVRIYIPDFRARDWTESSIGRWAQRPRRSGRRWLRIGGINPLLKSPKSNIWSATVERSWETTLRPRGLQRVPLVQHSRQRQRHRYCHLWSGHQ